jgi:hypothetical protein
VDAVAALVGHQPALARVQHEVEHVRRTIDDGRVHHGATPRGACLHDAGQQPRHQVHGAAADVAQRGKGRDRPGIGRRAPPQRARDGGIVVVVAGGPGQRPVLAPARHAAIDQARVEGVAGLGSQAQALHGAGPHAFDQRIGIARQGQHQVTPFGRLEIGKD